MKPKLIKLWLNFSGTFPTEIRADWDNDRHHAVYIEEPMNNLNVSRALIEMADLILHDHDLLD